MSNFTATEAIQPSTTTEKIIERFTQILKNKHIEYKRASDNSATQMSYSVDRHTTYKLTVQHTPYGMREWARVLDALNKHGQLRASDFQTFYFDLPKELLQLDDEDLVEAVLKELEYRSFENSCTEVYKQRLQEQIHRVVELGGSKTYDEKENKIVLWTENDQVTFKLGHDPLFELGRLSMLVDLMEGDYIHDGHCEKLSEGLKAYQKATQDSKMTESFNGMLCCDFERDADGRTIADGFVVQNDGTLSAQDAPFRRESYTDPLKCSVLTWFNLKDSDFMFSIRKETANSKISITVNKNRTKNGAPEKLSPKQLATVRRLIADYGKTWNPHVDFSRPDAYLNMVSPWDPDELSTSAAYRLIRYHAKSIKGISSFPDVSDEEKVTVEFTADRFKVLVGGKEYTVNIDGEEQPLFKNFSSKEARMFAKFAQAYEIKIFQKVARRNEAEDDAEFAATEMSDEERTAAVQEKLESKRKIAAKFRNRLEEINNRPGFFMIVFDNEENQGVYLNVDGVQSNYFSFTEEEYDHYFLIAIGDKKPDPAVAEPVKGPSEEMLAELSAESSNPDSAESEIPGQMKMEQKSDGNMTVRHGSLGKTLKMPQFIADAAAAKRAREAAAAAAESNA